MAGGLVACQTIFPPISMNENEQQPKKEVIYAKGLKGVIATETGLSDVRGEQRFVASTIRLQICCISITTAGCRGK